MSKIVIFLPDAGEVIHELTAAQISVGRTEESDIWIDDPSVSVRHAEFALVGGRYTLRDLGSTNGIRVNGKAVSEAQLNPGDRVRFGSVEGVFEPEAVQHEPQPLPPQESAPAAQSQKPSDFGNASPFKRKAVQKNPVQTGALAAGIAALAVFALSLLFVFVIHTPSF